MKVGILGSGQVGQALGRGFVSRGHETMIGSRGPDKLSDWVDEMGDGASAGTFEDAAEFGELVVFAALGSAAEEIIELAGRPAFEGKVVIDAMNPLKFDGPPPPSLFVGWDDSLGERVQGWLPDARVVKAFNIVGNAQMVDPDFPDGPPTMLICGNDGDAKRTVTEICESFGWEVADLGTIECSRALEEICMAWVYYGFASGGSWDHAFKLLRK